jgi:hypothetical protein
VVLCGSLWSSVVLCDPLWCCVVFCDVSFAASVRYPWQVPQVINDRGMTCVSPSNDQHMNIYVCHVYVCHVYILQPICVYVCHVYMVYVYMYLMYLYVPPKVPSKTIVALLSHKLWKLQPHIINNFLTEACTRIVAQ